jgi:hypothetical protein
VQREVARRLACYAKGEVTYEQANWEFVCMEAVLVTLLDRKRFVEMRRHIEEINPPEEPRRN